MRQQLTLAIEVISVVTALGVVVSVFIYSYLFGLQGVSYLAIASLADMLRDSMQTLVFAILFLLAVVLGFGSAQFAARNKLVEREYTSAQINLRAAKYGIIMALAFAAGNHLSDVITLRPPSSFAAIGAIITIVVGAIMFTFFVRHTFISEAAKQPEDRGRPKTRITPLPVAILFVATVLSSGWTVQRQISDGVAADMYPVDKGLCRGKYTVVWTGDSRMVARCASGGHIVVKSV